MRLFSWQGALAAAAVACTGTAGLARPAAAQNLGPFRQFLAIEPYYAYTRLDAGAGESRLDMNGYGVRLWVNLAPFAGPHWNLFSHSALAAFVTHTPVQRGRDVSLWHYGGEYDLFFVNRPLGGVVDPFALVGAGALRTATPTTTDTHFALSPGGGIRIPIPNRLELRAGARDAIVFSNPNGGSNRTTHNLEVTGAIGITF